MEEDSSVKASSVTRLRRRLSVENPNDTKSPSTPSTPTKKRGGRLAAKPQLELIDENVPQNSPQKRVTRRSIARDIVEPEEKQVTPSRRSTRIKSNTSIVSETTQSYDSPRAKRAAARRNSQVGSDNEIVVTPAKTRQTRKDSTSSTDRQVTPVTQKVTPGRTLRTRKDSASNMDKEVDSATKSLIIISEEPEVSLRNSTGKTNKSPCQGNSQNYNGGLLKSPNKSIKTLDNEKNDDVIQNGHEEITVSEEFDRSSTKDKNWEITENLKMSLCTVNLVNDLDKKPKRTNKNLNKSTSAIIDGNTSSLQSKRNRTKSWTTLTTSTSNEDKFYSDSEISKKGRKSLSNKSSSRVGMLNTSNNDGLQSNEMLQESLNSSTKKKKKKLVTSNSMHNSPVADNFQTKNNEDNEKVLGLNQNNLADSSMLLFEKEPSAIIETMVFIEDSDSNTESISKVNKNEQIDSEDQCVPVVNQEFVNNISSPEKTNAKAGLNNVEEQRQNDTCEPMDIDETMPENSVCLNGSTRESQINKSSRKSSLCSPQEQNISEIVNKSKRKSSISNTIIQELEKNGNENKSTLILSLKDVSSNDTSKSPQNDNAILSKSVTNSKDKLVHKILPLNCLTSTPVQQKDTKKTSKNTSISIPNNVNRIESKPVKEKSMSKEISKLSNVSKDNTSEEENEQESSKDANDLYNDEAEDAGDDYESGDSQNEEERRYERENEILEEGETLTSEDDISNDSNYEKDSFIISSAEEDEELLSGTGDDLGDSDNELTMSAKSKKKFNERKNKEQKNASKEMFAARHKINLKKSDEPKKGSRSRLDSGLLKSDEETTAMVPPKKNKRMRLDSTLNSSNANTDSEEMGFKNNHYNVTKSHTEETDCKKKESKRVSKSICEESSVNVLETEKNVELDTSNTENKKKKSKRLSESMYNESALNEMDISIVNGDVTESEDPLLIQIKPEPNTPQKDLDISKIHSTDREQIEQVDIEQNTMISMIKEPEAKDPLQSSIAHEEDNSNSTISENEEIKENYETILNEPNLVNKATKIKSTDISLNLNKKTKRKAKDQIIEELNLTEVKEFKNKKNKSENKHIENIKAPKQEKNNADDDSSSDSIDLKLLFSDDSNGSEQFSNKCDNKSSVEGDKYIPLKRTDGKTDILEIIDSTQVNNSLSFPKEKKHRKSNGNEQNIVDDAGDTLNFFIDTVGSRGDSATSVNMSLNTSSKKKKKNDVSFGVYNTDEADDDDKSDAPLEESFQSEKRKKNTKKILERYQYQMDEIMNESVSKGISSEKKKKILSKSREEDEIESEILNTSATTKKNKENSISENHMENKMGPNKEDYKYELIVTSAKKRKRKSSDKNDCGDSIQSAQVINESKTINKAIDYENSKKKRKCSESKTETVVHQDLTSINSESMGNENVTKSKAYKKLREKEATVESETTNNLVSKKRKERDGEDYGKEAKMFKKNSSDKVHVARLPPSLLDQLDDGRLKEVLELKKSTVVSTTDFAVQENRRRKNKPSNFLEESVFINELESPEVKKQKPILNPKVLPFIPTASTSNSGYTTNFQVQVIPKKMQFVAEKNNAENFKINYLQKQQIKKLRTYDLYKKHRNVKLSKY